MFNYLRSEFYRHIRQKGWLGLLLFIACAVLLIAFGLRFLSLPAATADRIQVLADRLTSLPFLLASLMNVAMVIFMIAFPTISQKEKPIHIQMISFGLKRHQVYFGDFLMQSLFTVLTALFTLVVIFISFGLFYLSVPGIADHFPESFSTVALTYLKYLPLYVLLVIALNTTMQFFYQVIKKGGWAIATAIGVNIIFPAIWVNLMAYDFVRNLFFSEWVAKLSPSLQVERLYYFDFNNMAQGFAPADVKQIIICFAVVTILFLTAGYLHYHYEEL